MPPVSYYEPAAPTYWLDIYTFDSNDHTANILP